MLLYLKKGWIVESIYKSSWGLVVTPAHKKDLPIFKHCAGGLEEFPNRLFKKVLFPLLKAHTNNGGIYVKDITKRKSEKKKER